MDQVTSFEERRKKIRAEKIAHFVEKVKPRLPDYRDGRPGYTEEQWLYAEIEYKKLKQLIQNCYVDGLDYSSPETDYERPKQQTKEEAEWGIDLLLSEMNTYEKRNTLPIMLISVGDRCQLFGLVGALVPYYDLAKVLYPEVWEIEALREKIREKRSKQAD